MASTIQPLSRDPRMSAVKRCKLCLTEKPRAEFGKHGVAKNGVKSWCRPCEAKATKARNAASPDRLAVTNRRSKLKRKYGVSLEQYDEMLRRQGGCCAICGTSEPGGRSGAFGAVFHVDHCHGSGEIRGLLCALCNTALGQFKDRADILAKAIAYLNQSRR